MDTSTQSTDITCQYGDSFVAPSVLGKVAFRTGTNTLEKDSTAIHRIDCGLDYLSGPAPFEFFLAEDLTIQGKDKDLVWSGTEHTLLISIQVNEASQGGLLSATEAAYARIIDKVSQLGYPHLVRVWNYFADINEEEQGLERYRQFCIGRYNAFATRDLAEQQFPSACAIGHFGGNLVIYALATQHIPLHFENPVQQQAYCYPKEYGPRSPSFARATLLQTPSNIAKVFVSGTASVVGSKTLHPDSTALQLEETLRNLSHLADHIIRSESTRTSQIQKMTPVILKVYVRHKTDLPLIKERLEQVFSGVPTLYVHADICRKDLLLEIDGIWNLQAI